MIKKIFLLLFITVCIAAQSPAKKWVIIQDLQDRIVYLDTSAIKEYDNQISLWGLTVFRAPQRVTPFTEEVSQIKSNLLFNTVTNSYSVIGTLYYDKSGRIIGESSAPRITGGEDTFELPIQPGSSMEALYQKGFTYKSTGELQPDESEFLPNTEFAKERPTAKKDTANAVDTASQSTGPIRISAEQNIALIDEANVKTIEKRDSIIEANQKSLKANPPGLKDTVKSSTPSNKADIGSNKLDKQKRASTGTIYDEANDQNVRGNIWSDGKKYVIQLSSWRQKDVAEKLVSDKKSEGHNAFLMKAELAGRGTWYRVRVGYFDTLQEAQEYRRSNNL